jgi:hypothetical protein
MVAATTVASVPLVVIGLVLPIGISRRRYDRQRGCGEQGYPHALHRLSPLGGTGIPPLVPL